MSDRSSHPSAEQGHFFFIDGVEKEKSFVIKIVSYLRTASMVTQANNPGINVHQGQAKI